MKKSISPGVGILLILVALGLIFGLMWYQSEAPLVNRLPKLQPMNAPGPPAVPAAAKRPSPVSTPSDKPAHPAAPAGGNGTGASR
jgi:hypothetical protein